MIFLIVLGAEYLFYLKSIATYDPAFLGYNNSVLARVLCYVAALASMLITYLIIIVLNLDLENACFFTWTVPYLMVNRKCREFNLKIMTPEKKTVNLVYIPRNLTTIGGPWYFW